MNIVIHLGDFHLLMSFLGGIRTIMEGYGFPETVEPIYVPNSVVYMLEGKASARALRCHLIETSLQQILCNKLIADGKKITDNSLVEINQYTVTCLKVHLSILMKTLFKVNICST